MKDIPRTKNALVVRTDFSNDVAWDAIRAAIEEPVGEDQFRAYLDFLDDSGYDGFAPERLRPFVPEGFGHTFIFIVDRVALTDPDRPILVVDLYEEPGRTFRVVPTAMWSVENNLSLANMNFCEFADNVDQDGVFRGFSEC